MDSEVPINLVIDKSYDCGKNIENDGWNSSNQDIDYKDLKKIGLYYNCIPFSSSSTEYDSSYDQSEKIRKCTYGVNERVVMKQAESNDFSMKNRLMINKENKTPAYNVCFEHYDSETFNCKICYKAFGTRDYLQRHELTHATENKFSCNVCFKIFKRSYDLNVHLAIHTHEKPYMCAICGVRFAEINNLEIHWQIHPNRRIGGAKELNHTTGKSFGCNTCAKQLKQCRSSILKPFDCIYCKRSFKAFSKLVMHRQSHTGKNRMTAR